MTPLMKTIRISNATGPQIDWLMAKTDPSLQLHYNSNLLGMYYTGWWVGGYAGNPNFWARPKQYSNSMLLTAPLLNEHKISRTIDHSGQWIAYAGYNLNDEKLHMQCDRAELIAGLRVILTQTLGETAEVPDEVC